MKPRRILIFSLVYYPRFVGGAEVAVKEITDRIPPGEISFEMIALNGGGEAREEQVGAVTVHRIFSKVGPLQKLLFPFAAYFKAKKLHRQDPYDGTWAIMASYAGFAAYLFKKSFPKIPFILTIQEGDHFGRREGVLFPLFKKMFAHADRIQAISKYLADWSGRMGATCPIDIVPNGVDYGRFAAALPAERKDLLRREWGASSSDIILVTASRLVFKNAIDTIIRALLDLDPSVKLLILGRGRDEAKLKALAATLKLSDRVIFRGFVPHADLPAYLQASDIFVRPSRTEGLGNSFLEAMAAGIPVIATPVGGIPDFLTDGETGLFCEVDNPQSIAQKVQKLTRDRESRGYITEKARDMVRDMYQWDAIAPRMRKLFI
ncbi:MAG: hypothetical protein JWO00_429 [Candidatus Parcubacteria bacterium]|nr:hypothetical protein [Candidatus Parcubacteria bacterium]